MEPKLLPPDKVPQGTLHLPAPEAVDQGVQHGHHQQVEHSKDLICAQAAARPWLEVQGEDGAVEDGDSSQVRGARGEGFGAALSRAGPRDSSEDEGVGDQDGRDGHQGQISDTY